MTPTTDMAGTSMATRQMKRRARPRVAGKRPNLRPSCYWFRKRFAEALRRMIKAGKIELPPEMCRFDALCRVTEAKRKKWIVDVEERYEHGEGIATYLARYVRGGPLKNSRLLRLDEETQTATFRVSRKGERWREMTLPIHELIRRILWHVPQTNYRVVRACGLYHHHYREQLEACRQQLGGGNAPAVADSPCATETAEPPDEEWILVEETAASAAVSSKSRPFPGRRRRRSSPRAWG